MVTPVQSDSLANILRVVPSAPLGRAGLLFDDGDPNPTPIFPVKRDIHTTPIGLTLAVSYLCLLLRPTAEVVSFRLFAVID